MRSKKENPIFINLKFENNIGKPNEIWKSINQITDCKLTE